MSPIQCLSNRLTELQTLKPNLANKNLQSSSNRLTIIPALFSPTPFQVFFFFLRKRDLPSKNLATASRNALLYHRQGFSDSAVRERGLEQISDSNGSMTIVVGTRFAKKNPDRVSASKNSTCPSHVIGSAENDFIKTVYMKPRFESRKRNV